MLIVIITTVVFAAIALGIGRFSMTLPEVFATIFNGAFPEIEVTDNMTTTIFSIRLPRVLLAVIAGGGLAVAGAAFQGVFSNPLATPDTIGVATGTAFGAALAILLRLDMFGVQFLALAMGIVAALIVVAIGRIRKITSIIMIVLAGLVVSALFSAMISLVQYTADPEELLPSITFWLLGSLSGTNIETLLASAPLIIGGTVILFVLRWKLNLMTLHEDEAKSLGVNVKHVRYLVIFASTMITASVTSVCGLIGWVGLLMPHLSRMAFGNDNRKVVPASIAMGALFLLVVDTIARSATAAEIPVSILTAVIGAPFFIILLRRTGGIKT